MIDNGADGGDAAEGDDQEGEDEPGGAAAGLVVRLGDAEGAEEGAGHVFKQMHGDHGSPRGQEIEGIRREVVASNEAVYLRLAGRGTRDYTCS